MKIVQFIELTPPLIAGILLLPKLPLPARRSQQRITASSDNAGKVATTDRRHVAEAAGGGQSWVEVPQACRTGASLPEFSQLVVELNFVNNSVAMELNPIRTLGLIADALHHPNRRGTCS